MIRVIFGGGGRGEGGICHMPQMKYTISWHVGSHRNVQMEYMLVQMGQWHADFSVWVPKTFVLHNLFIFMHVLVKSSDYIHQHLGFSGPKMSGGATVSKLRDCSNIILIMIVIKIIAFSFQVCFFFFTWIVSNQLKRWNPNFFSGIFDVLNVRVAQP